MLVLGPLSRGTEPAMVMIMNEEAHIDLAPRAAPAVADVSLLSCVRHIPNDRLHLAPGHLTHLQCAHRNHHASWSKAGACLLQKGRECMLGLSPLHVLSHPHSLGCCFPQKPEPSAGPSTPAVAPEQAIVNPSVPLVCPGSKAFREEDEAELCVSRSQDRWAQNS